MLYSISTILVKGAFLGQVWYALSTTAISYAIDRSFINSFLWQKLVVAFPAFCGMIRGGIVALAAPSIP
jgi:hypothetical protein